MTRDEILNMPAGREMDELIAEYVAKMERTKHVTKREGTKKLGWSASGWWWIDGLPSECPNFSGDIAAAWLLLGGFYSACVEKLSNGNEWMASLHYTVDEANAYKFASANTAPLAICRAALLAVMEGDK